MKISDTFVEHMIKQKWKSDKIIKSVLIISVALVISLSLFFIGLFIPIIFENHPVSQIVSYCATLLIAGVIYIAYRLICRFDVEYEYALTNGELDVDMIIRRKRRKRVISIDSKAFIEFGKKSEEDKSINDKTEYARVIDASAHSKIHEDYYAVFFKNGQKVKLYFNPSKKMIELFKIYAPRVVKE